VQISVGAGAFIRENLSPMGRYVALLRGINVGGNNLIKMAALAACFEKHGFENVMTYIQSGNVIFEADASAASKLPQRLEEMLSATFSYRASVVLRSRRELQRIVERAPKGFGAQSDRYRYDVVFLRPPLAAAAAMRVVPTKEGVDQVSPGPGVLYFSRLISKASQSRTSKIVSMPIYQSMTIRNWNTTTKLLQMMDGV
jgi:uncharacterized protein (DUF1697 family)